MGKRELILIAVFAVLGATVYRATAPPPAAGERGFSISGILDHVRREMRGNRASAETTNTATQAVDAEVSELRVALLRGPITIVGEDRDDVAAEIVARSNGVDEAEALSLAREVVLDFERSGTILSAEVKFPTPGVQTARLTLKVPKRLRVRIEGNSGRLDVSRVASLELGMARGDCTVKDVEGRVSGTHRGGDLAITGAGSLRLTTRGSDVRLERVRGEAVVSMQAGELRASKLAGPIELDSNAADMTLDGVDTTAGPLRITAVAGSLAITGLKADTRIDLRNTELDMVVDRAATIAVYSEGDEDIEVTPPADGYRLDVVARDGRILASPDGQLAQWGLAADVKPGETEQRVTGDVNGGGPLLTVRSQRGAVTLRSRQ